MRPTPLDGLRPGQIMGKAVIDESGRILLRRGVALTPEYIRALKDKGFNAVYVGDPEHDVGVEIDEDLNTETRAKAHATVREVFESIGAQLAGIRAASMSDAESAMESDEVKALMGHDGPLKRIHDIVPGIMNEVLDRSTLAGLTSIKNESTQSYDHAIDVCIVGMMIGKSIALPTAKMRQLATGCLLHDIGKVFMDPSGDAEANIRRHTKLGFELLRKSDNSELLAPYVAYEHHEHQDGTGLPRGLVGSNTIDRNRDIKGPVPTIIGEICAIANTYDNLLSGVGMEKSCAPDEAIEIIVSRAGSVLNKEIVSAFRRVVPIYPQGCQVMLLGKPYSGYIGIVKDIRPEKLDKPLVTLTEDNKRKTIRHDTIDIAEHPEIRLRCVNF